MTYDAVFPDDGDRTVELDAYRIPQIPEILTAEEAAALWAGISSSDIPDHAKSKLFGQLSYRLEEAAGKRQPAQSVVAGVFFAGASADEVARQRRALAAER